MPIRYGPCTPFATEIDVCVLVTGGFEDPCLTSGQAVPQVTIDNALQVASEIMWVATGRQFGTCTVTINPCYKDDCNFCDYSDNVGYPWVPRLQDGVWTNVSCVCQGDCVCTRRCSVPLPYPVDAVYEIIIDGVLLAETAYRVDDFRYLVRTDGECWPKCQDDFEVTLSYGRTVPALVQMATGALAGELMKSCVGAACELPKRMQSMTRQGVTVGFIDPMDFMKGGFTGIYLVDMAIKQFNPKGLQKQASVYSPDMKNRWRVTTQQEAGSWEETIIPESVIIIDGGGP